MSDVVDVGDAFELTFNSAPGSTVTVTWLDQNQEPVFEDETVAESPAASGKFPYTFQATAAGFWTAVFTASGASTNVEEYFVRAKAITGPLPLAAVGDVTSQFGPLTPAQEGITGWLLRAASKMVRAAFPGLDSQLAAGRLDPDVVALAVANMVLRVLRNPRGLRSETVGPFSRTYDTSAAAGLLVITPGESSLLTPKPNPAAAINVGTIMMRPGLAPYPVGLHSDWRTG